MSQEVTGTGWQQRSCKRWLDSGQILKAELIRFADRFYMGLERNRGSRDDFEDFHISNSKGRVAVTQDELERCPGEEGRRLSSVFVRCEILLTLQQAMPVHLNTQVWRAGQKHRPD